MKSLKIKNTYKEIIVVVLIATLMLSFIVVQKDKNVTYKDRSITAEQHVTDL